MLDFSSLILSGAIYAITYMVMNSLILKLFLVIMSRKYAIWSKVTAWDYSITMLVFPFSISLYYLNTYFGNTSILLCGTPFLVILYVIRIYHQSDKLNDKLSSATVIGRELSDRLGFEDVIRTFIVNLRNVVSYDYAYVLDLQAGTHLVMLMGSENNVVSKNVDQFDFESKVIVNDGLDLEAAKILNTKKTWGH